MFYLNLDLNDILNIGTDIKEKAEKSMAAAAQSLATATHAHIIENVQSKLHSSRQKYLDNLSFRQVDKSTWVISLAPNAFFIEDGVEQHEMIDSLLSQGRPNSNSSGESGHPKGKGVQTAADGSKFRVIGFEHSKGPTAQTAKQTSLTDTIKGTFKQLGIPYGPLETGANGKPKLGLVRSLDILKKPTGGSVEVGKHSRISLLQGVRVYQRELKDKQGTPHVAKQIMTFRIVSSKMKGTGRWVHPGVTPRKFMDEAFKFAQDTWEKQLKPEIMKSFQI